MIDAIIALISLVALEIVLGIDNVIFISILTGKLPEKDRNRLRYWGLGLAMLIRLILLAAISWILKLDATLFTLFNIAFSGKSIILLTGGLFLLYKATKEILHKTEEEIDPDTPANSGESFSRLVLEVVVIDLVFSIDSIITAVGMVQDLWVMYTAVIITVALMLVASGPISSFIQRHPSFKILALCFLMMIGVALVAESLHFLIPKGYIYFAMAFAFLVDVIQMKRLKK